MTEYIYDTSIEATFLHEQKREEIVRCRDCIYFATDELGNCCTLFDFGNVKNMENGFCAWGERRGE